MLFGTNDYWSPSGAKQMCFSHELWGLSALNIPLNENKPLSNELKPKHFRFLCQPKGMSQHPNCFLK